MSRDPIGVWGDAGNMGNEYAYAWNRPLVAGDPLGLQGGFRVIGGAGYIPHPERGTTEGSAQARTNPSIGKFQVVDPAELVKELGLSVEGDPAVANAYLELEIETTEEWIWSGHYCGAEKFRLEKKNNYTRMWFGFAFGLIGAVLAVVNPLAGAALIVVGAFLMFSDFWGGDDSWEPDGPCSWFTGVYTKTTTTRVKSARMVYADGPVILPYPVSPNQARYILEDLGKRTTHGSYDGPVGGMSGPPR